MKENEKANKKVTKTMKIKQNIKGITLIALVVTIVILLILATVTINLAVGQNGLFERAKNAVNAYKIAEANESQGLNEIADEMDIASGKQVIKDASFADAKNRDPATSTTVAKVADALGNTIYVPAGFKILCDSTTNNANTVDKGIVIQDKDGNQFVWIPVGTISTTSVGSNDKTITLGRYTFDKSNGTSTLVQNATDYKTDVAISTYYHELETSTYGNATAKSLSSFITSATNDKGYYLARYEAGVGINTTLDKSDLSGGAAPNADWTGYTNGTLVTQSGMQVWNYVTQNKASKIARGMYSTVNSDLVNSYAWETAIVFIEQCGTESNHSNYANQIGESENDKLGLTGSTKLKNPNAIDEQCNIYDMAGSVYEWTTESISDSDVPCVSRGGYCNHSSNYTANRLGTDPTSADDLLGFRPLLYL